MNTGFIHDFSEENDTERQQNNQNSIFGWTHGLLILLYRYFEVDAETGVLNILDIGIVVIHQNLRIVAVQIQYLPLCREFFFCNLAVVGQVVSCKTWSIPVGFQINTGRFTQWDKVDGLRTFQLDFNLIRQFLVLLQIMRNLKRKVRWKSKWWLNNSNNYFVLLVWWNK